MGKWRDWQIRQAERVPIMVLGDVGNVDESAKWLTLGVDAYLIMPVGVSVLMVRVRSLLCRYERKQS